MAVLHLIATLFMAGVIVFVQIVHYPLMDGVGAEGFAAYERRHTVGTGWVVGPPMIVELVTAVGLVLHPPAAASPWLPWIGLALLAAIWVSTAILQIPAHRALGLGFDPTAHRRLVVTNWIRTGAWLGRVPVALALAGLL